MFLHSMRVIKLESTRMSKVLQKQLSVPSTPEVVWLRQPRVEKVGNGEGVAGCVEFCWAAARH